MITTFHIGDRINILYRKQIRFPKIIGIREEYDDYKNRKDTLIEWENLYPLTGFLYSYIGTEYISVTYNINTGIILYNLEP